MLKEGVNGDIEFKDVDFQYDGRKGDLFNKFNLKIKEGHKVAFVGVSGCGKSTILQLIARFYIPKEGQILINGIDIKDFDIRYLRSCFGSVSQEPVLFNGSFADNIRYNWTDKTMTDVEKAATKANAISFIVGDEVREEGMVRENQRKKPVSGSDSGEEDLEIGKNKTGFDRGVGVKGSHISGGQKQRVAIARAILRNPEILLLDEATSALDSMNEKKVQESLDEMMKGKTSISIAHRL